MAQPLHSCVPDRSVVVDVPMYRGAIERRRLRECRLSDVERAARARRWRENHKTPPAVCEAFVYNVADVIL